MSAAAGGPGFRIAVNAAILGRKPTGLGVFTVQLVRAMAGCGADLAVFTAGEVEGVPARRVTGLVRPERGAWGHAARIAWSQAVFPVRARLAGADVALAATPTEGAVLSLVPQVVVVHDLLPLRFPDEYPRLGRFFSLVLPRIVAASRGVIACSAATKRDMVELLGTPADRVTVVHEGFAGGFAPGDPGEARRTFGMDRYFLFVGNLLPHKNLDTLVDAFALAASRTDAGLVIAGPRDDRYFPALERRVAASGVAGRVRFMGWLPPERLAALYRGAEAFVFPSLCEGFGLPLLEAMASGVPVIAANASSLPEVAGDAACLVDPRDAVGFADAMARATGDAGWRAGLVARGLERSREFSWERTAAETLAVLARVAGGAA